MKNRIFITFLGLFMSFAVAYAQQRETRQVGSFTKISFRIPGKLYLKQGSPQKVELVGDKDVLKEIETDVEGTRLVIEKEGKWFDWDNDDKITAYVTVPSIEGISVSGSGDVIGEGRITADDLDLNVSGSGSLTLEFEASDEVQADVSGSGDMNIKGKCAQINSNISGSGKVEMGVTTSGSADFTVSGSGRIVASGAADVVTANISGSGKVLAADLAANRCEVKISGSGDVEINVKNEIDATISGSGTVSYRGNPGKVNSHSSGSGSLRKM